VQIRSANVKVVSLPQTTGNLVAIFVVIGTGTEPANNHSFANRSHRQLSQV
jgi:hypothetical protein